MSHPQGGMGHAPPALVHIEDGAKLAWLLLDRPAKTAASPAAVRCPQDWHRSQEVAIVLRQFTLPGLFAVGDESILQDDALAFLCSATCPGALILQAYDTARRISAWGLPVVSGFHSPVERQCLDILLRGRGKVIWCLAHAARIPRSGPTVRQAVSEGHLLFVSPFGPGVTRAKRSTTHIRNLLVAALARNVLVVHAAAGGDIERCCRSVLAWGKPVHTFMSNHNGGLLAAGAQPIPDSLVPGIVTGVHRW